MAKKIVRGITDVKTITNQDYDTNNVNDLLSDGQYNYIHRKKGKNEEYHNLTDNIKTISSDNTELLSVTNNNKTTNTATLHPKHDAQKEQVLESTRDTISIHHGTNGTAEKTTVDTNPKKVLEHENLISSSQYVTIEHEEDSNTSEIKTDNLDSKLIELNNKIPTSVGVRNLLEKTNQGKTNWRWQISDGGVTAEDYNADGVKAVKLTRTSDDSFTWHYIAYDGLIRNLIEPNTKYTLSFDVRANVDVTFSAILQHGDGGAPLTNAVKMNKALANQWTKVSCVLTSKTTLPSNLSQIVYLEGMPVARGNYLIIKNIKLEKGVVPSDWSPSPEDIYPLLAQKEQLLESTRDTISINHGTNGTDEKTTVDTNPEKVLEHSNLTVDYGISKTTSGNTTKLGLEYTVVEVGFDLNTLVNGNVRGHDLVNAPKPTGWFMVSTYSEHGYCIQRATALVDQYNTSYVRRKDSSVWGAWREQVTDKSVIDALLAQKQDKLTAGSGITIQGNTISATAPTSTIQGNTISATAPTSTIQKFSEKNFKAYIYTVATSDGNALTTFSFECYNAAETVLTGELRRLLSAYYVKPNRSISNGAVSISNDGTNIKLINSAPSENVSQQGTFIFNGNTTV